MRSFALVGESISPKELSFELPSSKSISNRLLIIEYLAGKSQQVSNLSTSDDTVLLNRSLRKIESRKNSAKCCFVATPLEEDFMELECGNAGTTCRFLTALLSITSGNRMLTADKRMEDRPLKPLIEILKQLGAELEQQNENTIFPLKIIGKPLQGGQTISLPADLSSQFVSALSLIAPYMEKGLCLELSPSQVSRPYIDMTIALMRENGAELEMRNNLLRIAPRPYLFRPVVVEADWSAAAFAYSLVAIRKIKGLRIKGLKAHSLQGDSVVAEMFAKYFNVMTEYFEDYVVLSYHEATSEQKKLVIIDFKHCPDLFLPVLITAIRLDTPFEFQGLETLSYKESDRLGGAIAELKKVGVEIAFIQGKAVRLNCESMVRSDIIEVEIETYNDHRMAMAFALLAGKYGIIRIKNPDCVSKSFPAYWTELSKYFRIDFR